METKQARQRKPSKNITDSKLELEELEDSVHRLVIQNQKKLNEILKMDVMYDYDVYKPIHHRGINAQFKKELLLSQLDKLLEEQSALNIRLNGLTIQQEETAVKIEHILQKESNHYQTLRTVWKQSTPQSGMSSFEKVEHLNQIVAIVKKSIINLSTKQKKAQEIQQKAQNNQKLLLKIEKLQMQNEDLKVQMVRLIEGKEVIMREKNTLQREAEQLEQTLKCTKREHTIEIIENKSIISKLASSKLELEHKIKSLYKNYQHDSNVFKNSVEDFQVHICNQDLQLLRESTTKSLDQILDFLREQQRNTDVDAVNEQEGNLNPIHLNIPMIELKQTREERGSHNDRPKSAKRTRRMIKGLDTEELELKTKKYIRTSQIVTGDRNRTYSGMNKGLTETIKVEPENNDHW